MTNLRIQLGVMSFLVLAAAGGYLWWYAKVVSLSSMLTTLQGQTLGESEDTPYAMRSTRTRLEVGEAIVGHYLITEQEVPAFIDDLEKRGRAQGAAITITSVARTGDAEQNLSLALTIDGTFASIMRTLGVIEYAPYALTILSTTIEHDLDNTWHADVKLQVQSSFAP